MSSHSVVLSLSPLPFSGRAESFEKERCVEKRVANTLLLCSSFFCSFVLKEEVSSHSVVLSLSPLPFSDPTSRLEVQLFRVKSFEICTNEEWNTLIKS